MEYFQILFRGIELDLNFGKSGRILTSYSNIPEAMVDAEFYWEFQAGFPTLKQRISQLERKSRDKFKDRLRFVGHGVGGVLDLRYFTFFSIPFFIPVYAIFAALVLLSQRYQYEIEVYTYGQPRMGNIAFANYVNRMLPSSIYRITYSNDPIPKLPIPTVENGLSHHQREYWISPITHCDCLNSNFIVFECIGAVDVFQHISESPDCNAATENDFIPTLNPHLGPYFGHLMSQCPPMILKK
ncbi:hypothetical protein G9A89_005375 [Geosiphon pyriformis]|nr:hypothetical protein G9A89_005375 [Geosiphon pyriformis]